MSKTNSVFATKIKRKKQHRVWREKLLYQVALPETNQIYITTTKVW